MTVQQTLPKAFHERAAVQEDSQEKLLRQASVRGVALGNRIKGGRETDEPVITVLVAQKLAPELLADKDRVPRKIKSVPIDVVEVGEIFAGGLMAAPADDCGGDREPAQPRTLRRRTRPVMGGCSVGRFRITAGTIATCCYDLEPFPGAPQRYYILSNNHVLANSSDANIGDPILQPGPIDGGRMPDDVVARLSRFVPIRFIAGDAAPHNFVDAAVAEGESEDLSREVYWIGRVRRLSAAPTIGDIVQKTGRTTHFSTGRTAPPDRRRRRGKGPLRGRVQRPMCFGTGLSGGARDMMDQIQAVDELRAWVDERKIEGVAVVSDCRRNEEACLYVYVTSPEAARQLPAEFHGFKLYVVQGDPIHTQPGGATGAR